MTLFVTGHVSLATMGNGGFFSVVEDTASRRVVASSAEPYKEQAVRRILKAKAGRGILAPDDPDKFVDWLER
jgi:hypothetical protein